MNLNNISLPPQLIVDLYHHSLVEGTVTSMPQTPPVPALTPPVPALGKGGKGILIVVDKPGVPYLPDSELEFLTKVLTACGLGLADVAIINWSRVPHQDTNEVIEQFKAKAVILFAVEPSLFGLPTAQTTYQIVAVAGVQYVAAPALQQIEDSKEAKGQLWIALKQLFGI